MSRLLVVVELSLVGLLALSPALAGRLLILVALVLNDSLHDDLDPPVHRAARGGGVVGERLAGPEALCLQSLRGNAARDQEIANVVGSALRELHVLLLASGRVGV